jgi:predicted nucleic-acid-binding protein
VIGLDTNVLVRHLTQDDPGQSAKVARVIESAEAHSLFVSSVVVCEIVWVLEDGYDYTRVQIAEVLESLLQTSQLAFEDKDLLWQAVRDFRREKGDLADHVIGLTAHRAGCTHTLTFDKAMKNNRLFRLA